MKAKIDSYKLTRDQSRRTKLTEAQVVEVRKLFAEGYSMQSLATKYGVCRTTISYTVDPERYEEFKKKCRERSRLSNRRSRTSEQSREYQRELRNYKRKLLAEGAKFKES